MASIVGPNDYRDDSVSDQEIFDAVGVNDVKRVRELLDTGVDVNLLEYSKGWSPIHVAASRGAKQSLELLVQRGADLNIQVCTLSACAEESYLRVRVSLGEGARESIGCVSK